jgi:hypothetical protein
LIVHQADMSGAILCRDEPLPVALHLIPTRHAAQLESRRDVCVPHLPETDVRRSDRRHVARIPPRHG